VLATDAIEPAGYRTDLGGRWWRVVRDGRVEAGIKVSDAGGGHIDAWVCRSSGIHGTGE
jgi:hypothetical protein